MGKRVPCTVFSLYKEYHGQEEGNLLRALPNNRLCFQGTDTNPSTTFLKNNDGNTCTFQMIKDGTTYSVCEVNNSISLKQNQDRPTVFKICNFIPHSNFVLIMAKRSGLYLTTDENGRTNMKAIKKSAIRKYKVGLEAIFRIDAVHDSIDGDPQSSRIPSSSDANNNAVQDVCEEEPILHESFPNNKINLMTETAL